MIAMYDETGRITQVMTVYPMNYRELLTRRAVRFVEVSQEISKQFGMALIKTHYVKDDELTERPDNDLPFLVELEVGEVFEMPEMPACKVSFDDQTFDVEAGQFRFQADAPGDYSISVSCFPYKNKTIMMVVK